MWLIENKFKSWYSSFLHLKKYGKMTVIPSGGSFIEVNDLSQINSSLKVYHYIQLAPGFFDSVSDPLACLRLLKQNMQHAARVCIPALGGVWVPWYNFFLWMTRSPAYRLKKKEINALLSLAGFEPVAVIPLSIFNQTIPFLSHVFNFFVKLPLINKVAVRSLLISRPLSIFPEDYSVSVIVPCRNERGTIAKIVAEIPELGLGTEIVFVEGHSQDGTFEEILRVQRQNLGRNIKVFKQDGKGKKDAVYKGFNYASGDILMILDSDLTVGAESLRYAYEILKSGSADFVNCSRLIYKMEPSAMTWPAFFANQGIAFCLSWLFNQRITDSLCGTKVFKAADWQKIISAREIFGRNLDPFGDFDLLFGAAYHHLKILDLPVHYKNRDYGVSQISRYKQVWPLWAMGLRGIWFFKC